MTDSNPTLPLELCRFVDRLIHPYPEGRFFSAQEALEALEADMDFMLAGDVFTRPMLEAYMGLKWEEVYAYEHTPHPIEYQMYYSC